MTIKKAVLHYISACVLITVVIGLWNINRTLAQIIGIAALCDFVITFWKASRDARRKKDWWHKEAMESLRLSEQSRAEDVRERQVWEKEQADYKLQETKKAELRNALVALSDLLEMEEDYWTQFYENSTQMEPDKRKILSEMHRKNCYVMKELQAQIDAVRLIAKNNNKTGLILSKEQIARMKATIESCYDSTSEKALAKMREQAHRRRKIRENQAHEALLKENGFEPLSEEEMKDRLNDIDFMD